MTLVRKPRPIKCKCGCGVKFIPARLFQPWATIDCGVKIAMAKLEKKKAAAKREQLRKEKEDRKVFKAQKDALKPLQYYLKRTQVAVNVLRRAQDLEAGYGCITCGTHDAEEWHCGHWISVGASSATRYDYANLHLQCRQCNYFGAGRAQDYEARVPARIGQAEVDRLKNAKRSKTWTREELLDIETSAKFRLKQLMKEA